MFDSKTVKELQEHVRHWESEVVAERLNGKPAERFRVYSSALPSETKPKFMTSSGDCEVKRVYTPLDMSQTDYFKEIGLPGEYPFTRGRDPTGYRAWEWSLNFYTGYGDSKDTNDRLRQLYEAGSRELLLAFDLPTQLALDSDHPLAFGEVGKVGVALDTIADLEAVFEGLPLEEIRTGTVGNCIGPWAFAMFYVLGERRGLGSQKMKLWLQNDPFKEFTGRGTYIIPLEAAVDLASDVVEYACRNTPHWDPQWVTTSAIRWGGSDAAQEIGFGIANTAAYVEAGLKKGLKVEEIVPRLNIHMSGDNDLFEEIAKFRATRRLWAKVAQKRFNSEDPRALGLRLTTVTAGYRETAEEPLNNIVRLSMQVLASILGGAEHIITLCYDEALALPTLESHRMSSLIKHILHSECFVGNTADPLGGSYYIESLTNELEEQGRYWYEQVETRGGAIAAINEGFYLQKMADGKYKLMRETSSGERVVIGQNKFKLHEANIPIELFMVGPEVEARQKECLDRMRQQRDPEQVARCLDELERIAEKKTKGEVCNIVPATIEAVRAYVTVGEIGATLRKVFGEYKPAPVL